MALIQKLTAYILGRQPAGNLDGTEQIPVVQDGVMKRISTAILRADQSAFAAFLAQLPTADPHVAGHPWLNGGVVCVSQG